MSSLFDISGRVALVTGSSRGIGFAFACGLAREGARVVLHGRDPQRLEAAAAALREETGAEAVLQIAFDVCDPADVAAGIDRVHDELGPIDILINNAGIQRRIPFLDFPAEDWDEVIATNLTSAFLVGQKVARGMVAAGHGKIINVASVQSILGRRDTVPYAASKGGIAMLTKGMCSELAATGVQVNGIAPGYIATELTRPLVEDEAFSEWLLGRTPVGRWGDTSDLIGAIVFLSSGASDFVNGQILFVDGGMTAVV
jgi:gluconate 5-dehydrogenase